jgi:hypothetical protein
VPCKTSGNDTNFTNFHELKIGNHRGKAPQSKIALRPAAVRHPGGEQEAEERRGGGFGDRRPVEIDAAARRGERETSVVRSRLAGGRDDVQVGEFCRVVPYF